MKWEAAASYRFDVTGHPLASHDVTADGGSFEIKAPESNPADVTITCDGDSYLLFPYGRLDESGQGDSGRLEIGGNARLLEPFEQWVKGLWSALAQGSLPRSAKKCVAPTKIGALSGVSEP